MLVVVLGLHYGTVHGMYNSKGCKAWRRCAVAGREGRRRVEDTKANVFPRDDIVGCTVRSDCTQMPCRRLSRMARWPCGARQERKPQ